MELTGAPGLPGPHCLRAFPPAWSWGPPGTGPYHAPCVLPQLRQTEAELKKVDEAIALFQKML